MASMIDDQRVCKMCGTTNDLEHHHCIHGAGRRNLADEDGLIVFLCHNCHMRLHDTRNIDLAYIKMAQRFYEKNIGSRAKFMKRYGKSWL